MFNKQIRETVFTSEVAARLFSNMTATNTVDQSFLTTLRALCHKRLPSNETVHLNCRSLFLSEQEITNASTSHCMTWFLQNVPLYPVETSHNIHIVHTIYPEAGAKMMDVLKASAGIGRRYMTDYTRRDDLHVFFGRKTKALFYTDESERNTIIFTGKLELKQFHVLQMMIPKYLPRLFADSPLTQMEIDLLKSLGSKYAVEYEAMIMEFSKDLDIRAEVIRTKLAGFETVFERQRVAALKTEISSYQKDYEHYLSLMRDSHNNMQERMYTLAGLENSIGTRSGDSELMEYFMCNKNLTIIQIQDTVIKFVAHGYVDVYDEDAFEQYASNHDGFLYRNIHSEIQDEDMEKLYRAIFSDGVYKLRICAAYIVDMRTGLKALQHYSFPTESQTYLPNPHIQSFGCIGSYEGRFQEYMNKRDYVGAIDQAVVSARNLNFYDSSVMARFAEEFSRTNITCLEAVDGRLLTPREAITELEEQ